MKTSLIIENAPQKPNEVPIPPEPGKVPGEEPEPGYWPKKDPEIVPGKEPLTTPPSAPPEIPSRPDFSSQPDLSLLNFF